MVGGGDTISQQALVGGIGLTALPLIFAVRFLLGPLSDAAMERMRRIGAHVHGA